MVMGVIVWSFILAAVITSAGIAVFLWLNSKESDIDDQSYEQNFDPGELVAKYKYQGRDDADESSAASELRRYSQGAEDGSHLQFDYDEGTEASPPVDATSSEAVQRQSVIENGTSEAIEVVEAEIVDVANESNKR